MIVLAVQCPAAGVYAVKQRELDRNDVEYSATEIAYHDILDRVMYQFVSTQRAGSRPLPMALSA